MPWVAMGFSTLYLQLLGFSDLNAAILVAIFSFGCSLGSFGGGYIGEANVRSVSTVVWIYHDTLSQCVSVHAFPSEKVWIRCDPRVSFAHLQGMC